MLADKGGQEALAELGGKVVVSSGTADTAAAQIPSIQAAIQAKADAIVIAGNDPSALCPSLSQAQAAGIKIVSFDSDVTCPNHLFINQADTDPDRHLRGRPAGEGDQQHRRHRDPVGRGQCDEPERLDRGHEDRSSRRSTRT